MDVAACGHYRRAHRLAAVFAGHPCVTGTFLLDIGQRGDDVAGELGKLLAVFVMLLPPMVAAVLLPAV